MARNHIPDRLADRVAPFQHGLYGSFVGTWYHGHGPQDWHKTRFTPVHDGNNKDYTPFDTEVLERHLDVFRDVGIDFLVINATDGIWGNLLLNVLKLMDLLDQQPADRRIGVAMAIGVYLWHEPNRGKHQGEANHVYQELVPRPSYFRFQGKPLLVSYTYGFGRDWDDSRFYVGLADSRTSNTDFKDHLRGKERGVWGWIADEVLDNRVEIHTTPGWNITHNDDPDDQKNPPVNRRNGEELKEQLLKAIDINPKAMTIGCFNDFREESLWEPARFADRPYGGIERTPAEERFYGKDSYGDETPDWYVQIVRAYSLLRWGLEEGTYFRDRDRGDVYRVTGGQLRYAPSPPHKKPTIALPVGTLRRYLHEQRSSMTIETQIKLTDVGSQATWKTNHGSISYGGTAAKTGHARTVINVDMQDGHSYPKGMITHPAWQNDGFIEGSFFINMPSKRRAFFSSMVGFASGAAESDGVRLEVHCGAQHLSIDVKPDGTLKDIILDVSPNIAAEELLIHVHANGTAHYDWLVWIDPEVTICKP